MNYCCFKSTDKVRADRAMLPPPVKIRNDTSVSVTGFTVLSEFLYKDLF